MNPKHLYLIGVGGVGMVWIADWALANGWRVSGSDLVKTALTERLEAAGANLHYGVDPSLIPDDVDEVIITAAGTEHSPSYPEIRAAEARGLPISKRAQWVGRLTRQMSTLAVAGTHGKTTTTAMLGWILEQAGLDPTVFVGGSIAAWGGKTRIGKGPYLVLEADEFDRSFHNFQAQAAILLNLDADHLDYYVGGMPEIEQSYKRFLRNLPDRDGIVVAYGRDKNLRKICRGFRYHFRWYDETHLWPGLRLQIPGTHNLLNATAAAKIAHEVGVSHAVIKKALASFPGVGRRFEQLGKWQAVEAYDDYAHHPREVAATLQAFQERFPAERRVVVFQPHQKARTKSLLKEFGRCFDQHPPAELILAPIYAVAGREEGIEISNQEVLAEIGNLPGVKLQAPETNEELEKVVRLAAASPGVMLLMGAGSIRTLFDSWRHAG